MNKISTTALLFGLLTASTVGFAQTPQIQTAQEREAAAEAAQPEDTLTSQGIKVHGHWVIDILNPDGSLASHHEFENSLQSTGGAYLAGVLTGTSAAIGGQLVGVTVTSPSAPNGSLNFIGKAPSGCPQAVNTFSLAFATCNLGLAISSSGAAVTLTGTTSPLGAGTISNVGTWLANCNTNVTPANCPNSPWTGVFQLTGTTQSISVVQNQSAYISVTISFS